MTPEQLLALLQALRDWRAAVRDALSQKRPPPEWMADELSMWERTLSKDAP